MTTNPVRRYKRKLAILAEIETTYLTDAVPTAADCIKASNVTFTPSTGEEIQLDYVIPSLGHQGAELTGTYAELTFDVDVTGSGTAGTAPPYGKLHRACGFSETVTAGTDTVYEPIDDDFEAASLYFLWDKVRHILLGARGTFSMAATAKQIPRWRYTLRGLLGTITDQSNPSLDYSGFVRALPVSKANTTLSLFGISPPSASLSLDVGNDVQVAHKIGEEFVEIVGRKATGAAVLDAKTVATKAWFAIAAARTRGALDFVHGTAAGNIVQIEADQVEIGRPTYGDEQGILNHTIPLMLCQGGTKELKITVK